MLLLPDTAETLFGTNLFLFPTPITKGEDRASIFLFISGLIIFQLLLNQNTSRFLRLPFQGYFLCSKFQRVDP